MKGWVGLVGWPIADSLPTYVVTHQLQVERRTAKAHRPKTDALPLDHVTNQCGRDVQEWAVQDVDCIVLAPGTLSNWFWSAMTGHIPWLNQWAKRSGCLKLCFYHATLCLRGMCRCRVSVYLSVPSQCSAETDKRMITQITPHDSPRTLVFWCQRSRYIDQFSTLFLLWPCTLTYNLDLRI